MLIIGLYGLIGSGKTSFAKYIMNSDLRKIFTYINSDDIGKSLLFNNEVKEFIVKEFKMNLVENEIDKKVFRELLFNNNKLNFIYSNFIWPKISIQIKEQIMLTDENKIKVILIESSLIDGLNINFHKKIYIKCNVKSKRLYFKNILDRDGIKTNFLQLKNIFSYQKKIIKKIKYDYKIKNNLENDFFERGMKIIKKILNEFNII
ncbi:dephospho-CoA kinase [Spiroplasma turonicum]|uniref:Dephospho-CoA kinase n=1 Tax=Spiroplasma turonicum TaxID=216946 RepID=A0A0K1P5Y3_9MOLU|nr:dephospho-CoA kinase [Spiroplasma turonicum]AKU79723.1 dephospho-CoA kinase [Spiroplasma turonicum]ALX70741.1 dephospho-CoA kinase [Spiroplasma turonicum]